MTNRTLHTLFVILLAILTAAPLRAQQTDSTVYILPLRDDIYASTVRTVSRCLSEAEEMNAAAIIIDMNTYGGLLDAADSIRTMLLECPVTTVTFINNQAASAGALIAIATDRIYMSPGSSIGAATVVGHDGTPMPDKYQSFMRAMMRTTAEAHGRNGDTWHRDPQIAEAMVGDTDNTNVLTLTTTEAIQCGYCEGKATTIQEVISLEGLDGYDIHTYTPSRLDRFIGFMTNPAFQAILVMLIIGGLYFELQTPGIGFPLAVAITAAILYFAPLYAEGLAANWELVLFIAGLILIIIEIFVTPGFGFTGIAGIVAVVTGLAFALMERSVPDNVISGALPVSALLAPFCLVIIAVGVGAALSVWLCGRFLHTRSRLSSHIVLDAEMDTNDGYVSVAADRGMVGLYGTAATDLRPAGKVTIDGKHYEAAGDNAAFIEKGSRIIVTRDENGILYCRKTE